jgi:hypothetical protein
MYTATAVRMAGIAVFKNPGLACMTIDWRFSRFSRADRRSGSDWAERGFN